jgi:hypothetical protein
MSEVTPGAVCLTVAGEWVAVGAGAFVAFAVTGGCADDAALAFAPVAGFASEPPVMYGWLEGVIAGSWFVLLVPGWVVLETPGATDAARAVAFAGRCRK